MYNIRILVDGKHSLIYFYVDCLNI